MAVALNPLFSRTASGKLGSRLVFRNTRKGQIVATRPTITPSRTPAQDRQRRRFLFARRISAGIVSNDQTIQGASVSYRTFAEQQAPSSMTPQTYLTRLYTSVPFENVVDIIGLAIAQRWDFSFFDNEGAISSLPQWLQDIVNDGDEDDAFTYLIGFMLPAYTSEYLLRPNQRLPRLPFPVFEDVSTRTCLADNKGDRLVYGSEMPLCWE